MASHPPARISAQGPQPQTAEQPHLPACDECRNRKIKCNRELPVCSNCRRTKAKCEFPSRDRRASQAKQITTEMATFEERLSTMEQNLAKRIDHLTGLVSHVTIQQSAGPTNAAYDSIAAPDPWLPNAPSNLVALTQPAESKVKKPTKSGVVLNAGPMERFFGDSSNYAHFVYARQSVREIIGHHDSTTAAAVANGSRDNYDHVRELYDSYQMPSLGQDDIVDEAGVSFKPPPRALLEACVDFYLRTPSAEPPLFSAETLSEAIDQQYGDNGTQPDPTWILCFNSIILRSIGWASKCMRNEQLMSNGVDESVLASLLTDTNRAFMKIESFCRLRLVNVQALCLMALVARDYLHYNLFDKIFDRACQVAKHIGLHKREFNDNDQSNKGIESRNLMWLLYLVDKQRAFVRGSSCQFYIFECNMDLMPANPVNPSERLTVAHLELSCLLEEIYKHLYSPRANRMSAFTRQQTLRPLKQRLEDWSVRYSSDLESKEGTSTAKAIPVQLEYAFHVTKLLIIARESDDGTDESNSRARLEIARKALTLIKVLCGGSFIFQGGLLVLERLFTEYSMVAFYEVFDSVLHDAHETTAEDVELLSMTTSALGMLAHPSRPDSYCTCLHKSLVWCANVAKATRDARERSHERPKMPILPDARALPPLKKSETSRSRHSPSKRSRQIHQSNNFTRSRSPHREPPDMIGSRGLTATQSSSTDTLVDPTVDLGSLPHAIAEKDLEMNELVFGNELWMTRYFTQDLTATDPDPMQLSDMLFNGGGLQFPQQQQQQQQMMMMDSTA